MDHERIDSELIIERYLLGTLSAEEADGFEAHFLDCPRCLERLELTRTLRQGLAQVGAEEALRSAAAHRAGLFAALARLGRRRQAGLTLAALALAVLVPLLVLLPRLENLRTELERAASPQVNTPIVTLSPARGSLASGEPGRRIPLPPEPGRVVLVLELYRPEYPHYRATLRAGGEILWRGGGLVADPRGSLAVSLPSGLIPPGDYTLLLEGLPVDGEPAPVAAFPFRTRAAR